MTTLQEQQLKQTQAQTQSYATEGALKLRLDVTALLMEIERDLKGVVTTIVQNENGEISTIHTPIGTRRANSHGVQIIMKFLKSSINTAGIQGNLSEEQYNNYVADKREELTKRLFINMYDYEINENDFDSIVDDCVSAIELIVSRPINNLERESYTQTIKHSESATVEQKKGLLPI